MEQPQLTTMAQAGKMIINGQFINLFDLSSTPRQLEISAIATRLSSVIRFNGLSDFSVAQHSLILSHVAESVTETLLNPEYVRSLAESDLVYNFGYYSKYLHAIANREPNATGVNEDFIVVRRFVALMCAYDALIHDFTESFTGDIIRPLKLLIPAVGEIESKIDRQVRQHYKSYLEMPNIVNVLDKQQASIEAYYLTRYHGRTIIDINCAQQTALFNETFFSDQLRLNVSQLIKIEERHRTEPLDEIVVGNFLSFSKIPFEHVKKMNRQEIVLAINERFIELRQALDKAFEDCRSIVPELSQFSSFGSLRKHHLTMNI